MTIVQAPEKLRNQEW
uniref:Uncharacterized protein n=1 Tax=Moniliophthora roreri TaxID=221103 RepID=A0A0W0FYX7_MONRR